MKKEPIARNTRTLYLNHTSDQPYILSMVCEYFYIELHLSTDLHYYYFFTEKNDLNIKLKFYQGQYLLF